MKYLFVQGEHTYVNVHPGEDGCRFLAHPSQVVAMHQAQLHKERVEICSMNQMPDNTADNLTPEFILDHLQQVKAPAEVGGFRTLSGFEKNALYFAITAQGMKPSEAPKTFFDLMSDHPLIRAGVGFAFFGPILNTSLMSVMIDVYDIRRFISPEKARSPGKLRNFFRIAGPQTFFSIRKQLRAKEPLGDDERRAKTIWDAWALQPLSSYPRSEVQKLPNAFLFREYLEYLEGYEREGLPQVDTLLMASWRTTSRFLFFIMELWRTKIDGVPFEANHFFKRADEAEEFHKYISTVDNLLDNSKAESDSSDVGPVGGSSK